MLIAVLLMAGALTAGEPDGVIATAPATVVDLGASRQPAPPPVGGVAQAGMTQNLTTDEQIDRWIATRSADDRPYDRPRGESMDDGLPHGEVSVSVGTGGYRDYGAAVSVPLGENGRLALSYRQTENGLPYGSYGYGYGYDPTYGGAAFDDGGYLLPGSRPGVAGRFDPRAMRFGGSPAGQPVIPPNRTGP